MKIKQGFVKRKVKDKYLVVAVGTLSDTYKKFIELNETASFIWDKVQEGLEVANIAKELSLKYNIDFDKALNDTQKFIDILIKEEIVCE